jgi:hypothetical protein
MAKTLYFDESDKPRLVPSYCVFTDFLGYRHEIRESVERGDEDAVFQRFIQDIEPQIERTVSPALDDDLSSFPRTWDAKVFTDNVVLGYALWSSDGESEFGYAVSQLLEFQYAVALKGFFVRGGWAIGNLFMNHNTVFGASLLDAYDLERSTAVYPRIVLSEAMKDLVFHHMAHYAEEPPQCYHLLIDNAGMLMTNYLWETVVDGAVRWDDLRLHATLIAERLKEYADNEHVLDKYRWLAAYHNLFCDLVSANDGYSDSVRVAGEFPSYGLRQLRHDDSSYAVAVQAEAKQWKEKLRELRHPKKG